MAEIQPSENAIRVGYGRAKLLLFLVSLPILLAIEALFVGYLVKPEVFASDGGDSSWVAWIFAVFFGLLILLVLLFIPSLFRRHELTFDEKGLWWFEGRKATLIPWIAISEAAICETRRLSGPTMHVYRKEHTLEVFLTHRYVLDGYPLLSRFVAAATPPGSAQQLPCFRFPLPPMVHAVPRVVRGIQENRSGIWSGEYTVGYRV